MKYLEIEGVGRPEAKGQHHWTTHWGNWLGRNQTSDRWGDWWWRMSSVARVWGGGVVDWSLMTDEVFFFRLGFWFQFLLYLINQRTCILGFGWFVCFFFFLVLVFVLESIGLLPFVWFAKCCFFSLDWVCFLIYCLGLMLGFFFSGCVVSLICYNF